MNEANVVVKAVRFFKGNHTGFFGSFYATDDGQWTMEREKAAIFSSAQASALISDMRRIAGSSPYTKFLGAHIADFAFYEA